MSFAAEGSQAMLVELSVAEQRNHAVMEVIFVAPVIEVAGSDTAWSHACGGRSRALRSGNPCGDQGLHVVGPQVVGPVGEVSLLEVCTCRVVDDL